MEDYRVPELDALFAAAWSDIPAAERALLTVGIPYARLGDSIATVRVISGEQYEDHTYVKESGSWRRVEEQATASLSLHSWETQSSGYPAKIATITKVGGLKVDLHHEGPDLSGAYEIAYPDYWGGTPELTYAQFFDGSNTIGDYTYSVYFSNWMYFNNRIGMTDWCYTAGCNTTFQIDERIHPSEGVFLRYHFRAIGPVQVHIDGPDNLGWREPTTWKSQVSGGDGVNFAYSWERNNGTGWVNISTSPDLTLTPNNGETFSLRLTVTSAGRAATSNIIHVQTRDPLYEPVRAQPITGPGVLTGWAGDVSWTTGTPTGGTGAYVFEWHRKVATGEPSWVSVGTTENLTLTISNCDPHFDLRLTVVSLTPDYGFRQSYSHYYVENWTVGNDYCGG